MEYNVEIQNYYYDDSTELKNDSGLKYIDFLSAGDSGTKFRSFDYIYKTSDAFWQVRFTAREEAFARYTEQISEWANSARFE